MRPDVAHLADITDHSASEFLCDQFPGNHTGGHASRRFPGAAATAATVVPKTESSIVGVVGVSRPVLVPDVRVISAALIQIANQNGDTRPGGAAFKDTGKEFRGVRFIPLGRQSALARPTSLQIDHQIIDRNRNPGRNSVNDDNIPRSMTFAGRGDAEELSKRIARHNHQHFCGTLPCARHTRPVTCRSYRKYLFEGTLSTTEFNNMLQRYILFWLILSCAVAFFWPHAGLSFDPFAAAGGRAINVLIVVTMFGVGALLPVQEVNQVLQRWPVVLLGTGIQYLSMPLLAWSVVQVIRPTPEIATGILIVGCVPGAMASNVLTLAARGNVSYSVGLTTSATLLSPLVVPFTLWLTLDDNVAYDGWAAVKLLLLQIVVPVVSGHLLSRYVAEFRKAADKHASAVANASILAIIAIAVALNRDGVMQASPRLLAALATINIGGYLAGYAGAATFRLPEPMRRALTLEVGMQNAGAGIALAKGLFGDNSAAVIPCILYTFGCMLSGTVLATAWQWSADSNPEAATQE